MTHEKIWNVISLGAGVQSSTLALMAARGEITPMPDAAIFADTQAEPKHVYEWLDWLETLLPFPVYRVSAGNLRTDDLRPRVSTTTGKVYHKHHVPTFTLAGADEPTIQPESPQGRRILIAVCLVHSAMIPVRRTRGGEQWT